MGAPGSKGLLCSPQLLSYRRAEYDPSSDLSQVDTPIRQLILHMIQLDPGDFTYHSRSPMQEAPMGFLHAFVMLQCTCLPIPSGAVDNAICSWCRACGNFNCDERLCHLFCGCAQGSG